MGMKQLIGGDSTGNGVAGFVNRIESEIIGGVDLTPDMGVMAMSTESIEPASMGVLENGISMLRNNISALLETMSQESELPPPTTAQVDAATMGALIGNVDPNVFWGRNMTPIPGASEKSAVVNMLTGESEAVDYTLTAEAYDERENKNAVMFAIAFNGVASRQSQLGEALFPTVTIGPEEVGVSINTSIDLVYKQIERNIDGSLDKGKYELVNLLRASKDPTVLDSQDTRIAGVWVSGTNDAHFLDPANTNYTVDYGYGTITTAPFVNGVKVSLIGISQTPSMLAQGVMNETDAIDPMVNLDTVVMGFEDPANPGTFLYNTVKVNGLPKSNFTYSTQGQGREMALNFENDTITLTQADGGIWASLTPGAEVQVYVNSNMSLNLEYSDLVGYINEVSLVEVRDAAGNVLAAGDADYDLAAAALSGNVQHGFTLEAYRTNTNALTLGKLVKIDTFTTSYAVPTRAPASVLKPTGNAATDDSSVRSLIRLVQKATKNAAVTTLLDAASILSSYSPGSQDNVAPAILGVGRFYTRAYYKSINVSMNTSVDSIRSADRSEDIQQSLVNQIRDAVYNMYYESEYGVSFSDAYGGRPPTVHVVLATDEIIGRYLTINGANKLLGDQFDCTIVMDDDERMQGKIFATFAVFDDKRNSAVNPHQFGNMIWAPEIVVNLTKTRGQRTSKEITVTPRYRHIVNLPILTEFTVTNIASVLGKVEIWNSPSAAPHP